MTDAPEDSVRWARVIALFEELLDSESAESVLGQEPDQEVRADAANLWRHHLEAEGEEFLAQAIPFALPPMFQPGRVLAARFQVQRLLGAGGMGEVYLATDQRLNEQVALKTIARALVPSAPFRRRFLAEVQNARRVTHPNVCRIYDVFDDGEITFFAMEFVEGEPLSAVLANQVLTPATAQSVVRQMAEGLYAAHQNGIVHGDFKPANVMISGDPPRAVITDFGLARALAGSAPLGRERAKSIAGGTLEYMSPELIAGGEPSVSSDIYAFGKVAENLMRDEKIWTDCVRSEPQRRPKSLEPILKSLHHSGGRRYFLGAFLAAAATGAAVYKLKPARTAWQGLEFGARLLVNGFTHVQGDLQAARLARSIFLTGLIQSSRLRAISDQDLLPALKALIPLATLPVAGEALHRLLVAERAHYWIEASLHQAGGRYALDLHLRRSEDGQELFGATLNDMPGLAAVAQAAAEGFRRAAGESTKSIEQDPATVTQYTSTVPEALEKYYEAMDRYSVADMNGAIPLLEQAIRLDENFAQAYNILAMCLNTKRRHAEAFALLQKAFDLSQRLPLRERAWIAANYYMLQEDPVQMVNQAILNASFSPDESRFQRVLAQVLCRAGRPQEALGPSQRSVDLSPQNEMSQIDLIVNMCEAGRFADALARFEQARAQGDLSPNLEQGAGLAFLGLGDYEQALRAFERMPGQPKRLTEGAKVLKGDLESALGGLEQYLAGSRSRAIPADEHQAHEFLCGTLYLMDRPEEARMHVRAMTRLEAVPPYVKQLECTAFWAGLLQERTTLKESLDRLEEIERRWTNSQTQASAFHGRAILAWITGDFGMANSLLLQSLGSAPSVWNLFNFATLHGVEPQSKLPEEYWVKFEERKGTLLKFWFPGLLILSWLNRASAANLRADHAAVRNYAGKIISHWGASNPNLGIVRTARNLLAVAQN